MEKVEVKDMTEQYIKVMLITDVKWLYRGIVAIYERQTEDEQQVDATVERNGVGFNSCDANLLSSFAKQLLERGTLTERQRNLAREKMLKYAGQLLRIARAKSN